MRVDEARCTPQKKKTEYYFAFWFGIQKLGVGKIALDGAAARFDGASWIQQARGIVAIK